MNATQAELDAAKKAFFPPKKETSKQEEPKKEEGTLKLLDQDSLKGVEAYDKLSEEEKSEVVTEINEKQKTFADEGKPMDISTLVTNGVRRAVDIVSSKNKTLERKIQELEEEAKKQQSKSSLDDTQVKELVEKSEEYKTMQAELESIGFSPKQAVNVITGLVKNPESFRTVMKAQITPEQYKKLFVFEGTQADVTIDDANEWAEAGFIPTRSEFKTEEEYLQKAKKFSTTLRKASGIGNVEELTTDIAARVKTQIEQELGGFKSDMQTFKDLIAKRSEERREEPREVKREDPKEEEPAAPQENPLEKQLMEYGVKLVDKLQLTDGEIEVVQEALKSDEEYLNSLKDGINVANATGRLVEITNKVVSERGKAPAQTTVMGSGTPTPKQNIKEPVEVSNLSYREILEMRKRNQNKGSSVI